MVNEKAREGKEISRFLLGPYLGELSCSQSLWAFSLAPLAAHLFFSPAIYNPEKDRRGKKSIGGPTTYKVVKVQQRKMSTKSRQPTLIFLDFLFSLRSYLIISFWAPVGSFRFRLPCFRQMKYRSWVERRGDLFDE